jgi:hypothetical protein
MLFIIAINVLQQMMQRANRLMPSEIDARLNEAIKTLQYLDDTIIIASANTATLIVINLMLNIFTNISGLEYKSLKKLFCSILSLRIKS